jgi:hypothetical protein
MNINSLMGVVLLTIVGLATPAKADQAQPTTRQILDACVQNRAETLPNPFSDVSPNHWAFKAVLTMHYCGAFRQATPPRLIEQLVNQSPNSPAPVPIRPQAPMQG